MEYKEKVTLIRTIAIDDEDEEGTQQKEESKKEKSQTSYDFTAQLLFRENVMKDILGTILVPKGESKAILDPSLVENPTAETLARAQVKLINKLIFDSI